MERKRPTGRLEQRGSRRQREEAQRQLANRRDLQRMNAVVTGLVLTLLVAAGSCAVLQNKDPQPTQTEFSSPTAEGTVFITPLPESTTLNDHQIILNEINKRTNPNPAETAIWDAGLKPDVTYPPFIYTPPSQEDINTRGMFATDRFFAQIDTMKESTIESIRTAGEFIDNNIDNYLAVNLDLSGTPQDSMSLGYNGSFSANFSSDFILDQSGQSMAVNLVRLVSGLHYVESLQDPFSLTDDQFLQFLSVSYADEMDTYLKLSGEIGYFPVETDPKFERILSTYIQYGPESLQYEREMRKIMNQQNDNPISSTGGQLSVLPQGLSLKI